MSGMIIPTLIVVSSAHEVLFKRYFLPSLPDGLAPQVRRLADNNSDGSFLSAEWQEAMCAKVRHALEFCKGASDKQIFIVCDVDVQFFPCFDSVEFVNYFCSLDCDMAFQKERFRRNDTEACCGFYIARNTENVRGLLKNTCEALHVSSAKNEQVAVNSLLKTGTVSHKLLDSRFYARTHGFPPPRELWIHHANWTTDIPAKIRQLERVRRIMRGGVLRLHAESYAEMLSRPLDNVNWLRFAAEASIRFLGKVPLEPSSLA